MIRPFAIAAIMLSCLGCRTDSTVPTAEDGDATGHNAKTVTKKYSVNATAVTTPMVGKWGTDNGAILIVTASDDRIEFTVPANDTWRIEISDVKIVDDTVHFTKKYYLHDGEHPFNGVANKRIAKLADVDTLELASPSPTKDSPKDVAEMLKRIMLKRIE